MRKLMAKNGGSETLLCVTGSDLKHGTQGFTLIEMSVVVAILGLLYYTVVPLYATTIQRARETALRDSLSTMRKVIDQYYRDYEVWPSGIEELVEKNYIRSYPIDPMTRRSDTWVIVPSDVGESDMFDIRSGADGNSIDGPALSSF